MPITKTADTNIHEKEIAEFLGAKTFSFTGASPQNICTDNLTVRMEQLVTGMKKEHMSAELSLLAAEVCTAMNLIENAQFFIEKALSTDPSNDKAINALGQLFLQKQDIEQAADSFIKALEINPSNLEAQKNVKSLYATVKALTDQGELHDMKTYWNACSNDNAMRHIATDNWQSEEIFHACGERDLTAILSYMDNHDVLQRDGSKALEIGCGIGRMIKPLAIQYPNLEIYGVDVSDDMVLQGNSRLKEFNNVELMSNNGKELDMFDNRFFDVIYSYIVLQHIPRKFVTCYFREVSRTLKKEGLFVFQMPMRPENSEIPEPPDSDFRTVRHYTHDEILELCNVNGLNIIKTNVSADIISKLASAWFIVKIT